MPSSEPSSARKRRPWIEFSLLFLILAGLSWIEWQRWEHAWIERSAEFYPMEWKETPDAASLAWRYPIYRSNDSYQWVHVADALAQGDQGPLRHRWDEGPPNGRSNHWHSGLARILSLGGQLNADINDWPIERGIHHLAHWLGCLISWVGLIGGSLCFLRLSGTRASLCFALLYFFNAGTQWDFAFSRLDHEAVYQLSLLFQLLGLAGLFISCTRSDSNAHCWALLAGIATAVGWWVSATTQIALELLLILGILGVRASASVRTWPLSNLKQAAHAYRLWGISGSLVMLGLLFLDSDLTHFKTAATLQPVFVLAHLGAALVCAAAYLPNQFRKQLSAALGLILGASPIVILVLYGSSAHPWLDPFQRAVHQWIVEFQSPFSNGIWSADYALQALFLGVVVIGSSAFYRKQQIHSLVLVGGLLILTAFQSRWLGYLATSSVVCLCLTLNRHRYLPWIAAVLILFFSGTWFWQLKQIETNPGRSFVTDMFLQVGARDINLNLDAYLGATDSPVVAMPYAFSATSALFDSVHPLGTFYWENRDGIAESTMLFASQHQDEAYEIILRNRIQYLVVQADGLGRLFANMVAQIAHGSQQASVVEATLAWRLSINQGVPEWCEEVPFYGTFDPQRFDARIYRVRLPEARP